VSNIEQNESRATQQLITDFAGLAERIRQSTVWVKGRSHGSGSGVIWNSDGLIITNSHVVMDKQAEVKLADGRAFDAEVISRNQKRDLAALKVKAIDLPAVAVGDSSSIRVGELVFAVGNPLGHKGALTTGIIHATNRKWVQADLRLAPGNSGGPLVNAFGAVIGINCMIAKGLALAIPSKEVERFVSEKQSNERPLLGITMQPIPVPFKDKRILGLIVLDVHAGSAAEKAGLLIGDILIGISGHLLNVPDDLTAALENVSSENTTIELDLIRSGKQMSLTTTFVLIKDVVEAA
jgi:serine protease Do